MLTLEGKCLRRRAKPAHLGGHLPVALTRQVSNAGTFAYTLYIDTRSNYAFIHELPLNDQVYPTIAHCIDLPVGKSAALLHFYTLALSPDGGTLYAANGALGVVSTINVTSGDPTGIFNDKVLNTAHFNPGNASVSNIERERMLYNGAALSSDQKTLYFAGIQGLWAANTSNLNIQGHYLAQQTLTGVALSSDNQTLYAVDPAKGITLLNATTGQIQKVMQGAAHSPWGIAWIVN
jgi:DNA-binding beta-propeller fold protein YncE